MPREALWHGTIGFLLVAVGIGIIVAITHLLYGSRAPLPPDNSARTTSVELDTHAVTPTLPLGAPLIPNGGYEGDG